jgi:hypothetical protein
MAAELACKLQKGMVESTENTVGSPPAAEYSITSVDGMYFLETFRSREHRRYFSEHHHIIPLISN